MKSKISLLQIFLLLATTFVIVFVGYAVYQFATEETVEQTEEVAQPDGVEAETETQPIESPEDLDEALEELEMLDPDEELDVESDLEEELDSTS